MNLSSRTKIAKLCIVVIYLVVILMSEDISNLAVIVGVIIILDLIINWTLRDLDEYQRKKDGELNVKNRK